MFRQGLGMFVRKKEEGKEGELNFCLHLIGVRERVGLEIKQKCKKGKFLWNISTVYN